MWIIVVEGLVVIVGLPLFTNIYALSVVIKPRAGAVYSWLPSKWVSSLSCRNCLIATFL
mgnify:CR=1 FL=1